jgi:hypothetical protein
MLSRRRTLFPRNKHCLTYIALLVPEPPNPLLEAALVLASSRGTPVGVVVAPEAMRFFELVLAFRNDRSSLSRYAGGFGVLQTFPRRLRRSSF